MNPAAQAVGLLAGITTEAGAEMQLGTTTFAETLAEPGTGRTPTHGERLRDLVEEAVVAEQAGLDVYGVGEHHRADAASSPAVVLAAMAARTDRAVPTSASARSRTSRCSRRSSCSGPRLPHWYEGTLKSTARPAPA